VTKAALNRMTTWYAAELESSNIAVNAISPGDVSVYMRVVNGVGADETDEVFEGEQLDEAFWGDPVVWLAGARPSEMTGEIVHTYTFGEAWGPRPETPPPRSPIIEQILGRDNLKARAP
jgi:NAD(P)-dependent dehydrogenase (short-subunit alcohol dehydrogenase family)